MREVTDQDQALLLRWWLDLQQRGELETTFHRSVQDPAEFLRLFARPTVLLLDVDTDRIVRALWYSPFLDAVAVGFWVHPGWRYRQDTLQAFATGLDFAFTVYPTVICLTVRVKIVVLLKKLGYTLHGPVRGLWGSHELYLGVLTKEGWHGRNNRRRGQKQRRGRLLESGRLEPDCPVVL